MLQTAVAESENSGASHLDRWMERLTSLSVLSGCHRQDLVRLVPYLHEKRLQPGEFLCHAGQPARALWLLLHGTLRLEGGADGASEISEGLVGEEAAIGAPCYLSDIVAQDEVAVLVLPREILPAAWRQQSSRTRSFYQSMLAGFTSHNLTLKEREEDSDRLTRSAAIYKTVGWSAAVVVPFILLWFGEAQGLRWDHIQLIAALISAAILWLFRLVPPYVATLFIVLVCVTLGVVPSQVILSGFTSDGFFMALSVFGLGAVMVKSGVIVRAVLMVLQCCARTPFQGSFAAMILGLMLTPVLPSARERVRVLAPLLADASQSMGYTAESGDATRLALSGFLGMTLFSPVLLTSSPLNLALYGCLPEQVQQEFSWLQWALAAAVAAGVLLLASTAFLFVVLRQTPQPHVSTETLRTQLRVLGPMRATEWLAVGGGIVFLGALMTASVHRIDHRLIALTIITAYLVMDVLKKEQINVDIDWRFLMLLGTLIGLVHTIVYVDLHTLLAACWPWLSHITQAHPRVFIVILATTVLVARFFIPLAGAMVALCFMPWAMVNGVHPWVVIFVILMMHECWLLPYQSDTYRMFRRLLGSNTMYDERLFLKLHAASIAMRIVAIVVSVVYWEQARML